MKKLNLSHRTFLTNFALQTIFLIFLLVSNISPQVVIKERIEIGGIQTRNNLGKNSSIAYSDSVVSGLIMPKNGILQVQYLYLKYIDPNYEEMPLYSTFNTYFFKNDSTIVDSLALRFQGYMSFPRNFPSCSPSNRRQFDYWDSPPPVYYVDNVFQGDTIKFTYNSDIPLTNEEFEYEIYSATEIWEDTMLVGWDIIFGNYDSCLEEFDNYLNITIEIINEYELIVSVEPEILVPGDTADVIIKKKIPDGTLTDFDTTRTFEVGMLEGCMSGTIIVGSPPDTGSYFYNVHQPIRFAAADSLVGDSAGIVRIRVGLVDSVAELKKGARYRGESAPDDVVKKEAILSSIRKTKYKEQSSTKSDLPLVTDKLLSQVKNTGGVRQKFEYYNKTDNSAFDTLSLYCFYPSFWQTNVFKEDTITIKKYTILLGETKYFQSKRNTSTGELKIEEIEPDENGIPQQQTGTVNGWEWITTDIWIGNPVTVDTCNNCGKKMGVYWEKKYPTNDFIDVPIKRKGKFYNYKIIKMDSLQTGLIRLVGRYWDIDSTYLVTLKAKIENGDSGQIQIKVVKPQKLLSSGQSPSYEKSKDVGNDTINIDSLCIIYGGKYGIPPQIIKGQMFTESAKKNFGGQIGYGFAPSYRYEPFTTQYEPKYKTDPKYNSYYIYDSTYTFPDVPIHFNVQYIDYPTTMNTVWEMIENYSKLVNPDPSVNYYGGRDPETHRVWLGYEVVDTIYTRFSNEFAESYPELTEIQKYDSTNNKMIDYLKYEWTRNDAPAGTKTNIAQTRTASSYGLAQFLYGTARDIDYPEEDVPENINLISYLYLFYETQKKYLQEGVGANIERGNNWPEGYEYSFCRSVYVPRWNTKTIYAKDVIDNSKRFFPQ